MFNGKMHLEQQLCNHIKIQDAARKPDVFGIEVELEGKKIVECPQEVKDYWAQHPDGSLRAFAPGDQAIEYVSRVPYDLKTTEKAVSLLFNFLNKKPCQVYESYRTSIHIHVNFGMETFRTIYNFMTLALLLDELFVSQNGDHRIGNNFCLRAKDAMGQVVALIASVNNGKNFFHITANERYSSINFASLMKFGSIEFRSLECTTHQGRLMHWIGTLNRLKQKAKTFKNPTEIIQLFSQKGPRAFLTEILGPYAMKYINVRDMDQMLHNGMRIAQELAYCSAWNEISQKDIAEKAQKAKAAALKKQMWLEEMQ
jgi:hypothetical protein